MIVLKTSHIIASSDNLKSILSKIKFNVNNWLCTEFIVNVEQQIWLRKWKHEKTEEIKWNSLDATGSANGISVSINEPVSSEIFSGAKNSTCFPYPFPLLKCICGSSLIDRFNSECISVIEYSDAEDDRRIHFFLCEADWTWASNSSRDNPNWT